MTGSHGQPKWLHDLYWGAFDYYLEGPCKPVKVIQFQHSIYIISQLLPCETSDHLHLHT